MRFSGLTGFFAAAGPRMYPDIGVRAENRGILCLPRLFCVPVTIRGLVCLISVRGGDYLA